MTTIALIIAPVVFLAIGYLMPRPFRKIRAPQNIPGKPEIGYLNRDKQYFTQDIFPVRTLFTEERVAEARERALRIRRERRAKR